MSVIAISVDSIEIAKDVMSQVAACLPRPLVREPDVKIRQPDPDEHGPTRPNLWSNPTKVAPTPLCDS